MTVTQRIKFLEEYMGDTICPSDFKEFWQEKLESVKNLKVEHEKVNFASTFAEYEMLHITMPDGSVVNARYIRPQGDGKFPTAIMYHDMGRGVRGWHHMTRFVGFGYAVVALENRIEKEKTIKDMTPDDLLSAYLDALAVGEATLNLPHTDCNHLTSWGEGFGGGLSVLIASLLEQKVNCCCLHPMPSNMDKKFEYVDLANFAPMLHAPMLMGTALMDEIAPAENQYTIYNRATCEKRHINYPKYIHERINAFENEYLKFLAQNK